MRPDVCRHLVASALLLCCAPALALSIAFSPASPSAGEAVGAILTQPFNCAVMPPRLKEAAAGSITFESLVPDGVVHCPFIPDPPPTVSVHSVDLGALSPGTYAATWNVYLYESSGVQTLLESTTASLVVAPGGGGPAPVNPIPALSAWTLFAMGGLCAGIGLRRLRRVRLLHRSAGAA